MLTDIGVTVSLTVPNLKISFILLYFFILKKIFLKQALIVHPTDNYVKISNQHCENTTSVLFSIKDFLCPSVFIIRSARCYRNIVLSSELMR